MLAGITILVVAVMGAVDWNLVDVSRYHNIGSGGDGSCRLELS